MERRIVTELRVGEPLRVGAVTIVPLEEVRAGVGCDAARLLVNVEKRAAGIVILDGREVKALDGTGRDFDLADLLDRVVGLREILASERAPDGRAS